ncbi:hypothetical protein [Paractinoplanes brasiliensis]|uniref:Uncharacterized protein n=1 Tax=Paractinoplanes brasiliensis TaxID=52695 RepID=A0A4V3C8J5_9ACTN|nr:hypothetical protein [Actinoplanes brasiliensis]TDO41858.1 hypothetical protein C8E87_5611 [Actinoplanes brasiliensis]GID29864.1 hypothetical protein Abr02nite_48470 [Actinoplanes brasiliensis]
MTEIGAYTFLPWFRQGIANSVEAADLDPAVRTRATVDVQLRVTGTPVVAGTTVQQDIQRDVELYGPGDVIGVESRAIVKVEPRDWITNFEPNYLPYIDFYDEDFPWRYTPAAPQADNKSRLRPWLALVVLAEDEFRDGAVGIAGRPLPFVDIADPVVFPPSDDLWAWAHVHVNQPLVPGEAIVAGENSGPVLDGLATILATNPDLAYSRIVSPRLLETNTAYHAFLMPVFESGRLAGLGADPAGTPFATHAAWDPYPNPADRPDATSYPYYHRWYFRTGTVGDFEYLVRLLEPRPMDVRVGRRDIDVQAPGSDLPGITDPALHGVLRLGGALQVPAAAQDEAEQEKAALYENWDEPHPHPFQTQLAAFVNLADDYARIDPATAKANPDLPAAMRADDDPDPLMTPPIYGRWHAKTPRLLTDADGWVHELNLDPRFRTAAGFGTDVVRANQEAYMNAAWEQLGDVLAANREIRLAQVAVQVSWTWHQTMATLATANPQRFLGLTTPVDGRVLLRSGTIEGGRTTRLHQVRTSIVPRAASSAPMRRILRPRGRTVERLGLLPDELVGRINDGSVQPAPPKVTPPNLSTVDDVAGALLPPVPGWLIAALRRSRWLLWLLLLLAVIAVVAGLSGGILGGLIGILIAAGLAVAGWYLRRLARQVAAADAVGPAGQTPEAVDRLPARPDFTLQPAGSTDQPAAGGTDATEAVRLKQALREAYRLVQSSAAVAVEPARSPLVLDTMVTGTLAALHPAITVPRRIAAALELPTRITGAMTGDLQTVDQVFAYPRIDLPMYAPLAAISPELLLPNLDLVAQNSISLLETNQRFIESYLVGLNHEFARELLWREYLTDQRGSYFRQFWDAGGRYRPDGGDPEAQRESLRDIPPLHEWPTTSHLGDHDNRAPSDPARQEVVLVVRGELLKKYPTAVIYAHRAEWTVDDAGAIDRSQPRRLVTLSAAEEADPPLSKVKTPLYEAKVDPDIYFFGFDLTTAEAAGETEADPDDPGWFFVIKERPGEPRFGFDIEQDGGAPKSYWNDLSWADVLPGGVAGDFLRPAPAPAVVLVPPPGSSTPEQQAQHAEDVQVGWHEDVSAAELAYVMYQVPVLVAVHATRMLPG